MLYRTHTQIVVSFSQNVPIRNVKIRVKLTTIQQTKMELKNHTHFLHAFLILILFT